MLKRFLRLFNIFKDNILLKGKGYLSKYLFVKIIHEQEYWRTHTFLSNFNILTDGEITCIIIDIIVLLLQ